jgi:hypothetical protein
MISLKNWIINLPQQYKTHRNADLPLDEYLSHYHEKFKRVTVGCSFDPDLVVQMYERENQEKNISAEKKLHILKVLIHDFGITEIRLGIKWNRVVNEKGIFDFSYYHEYLDYCLTNKVNVCLNIGPIKTFGWPEEFVPQYILDKDSANNTLIDRESVIGKSALEYVDILLSHIQSTYSKIQLENLVIIQPENEAFNIFGKQKFILSDEYLIGVIKKINTVFPNKKILLCSSETRDISSILHLMQSAIEQKNLSYENFIVGINYYYNLPNFWKAPRLGPLDNITISNLLQRKTHQNNINKSRRFGYEIEVTEAQFEQWGKRYLSPGFSHHEAKYLIGRIVDNILDSEKGGIIRLWGLERYAKKKSENTLLEDQEKNINLITSINSLK